MATFNVKNFDRFQHYKDRSPPWIKLYNELLDDYAFGKLPDASKMHLVAIWLLASRSDNQIPYDPEWVAKRINATEPVNLGTLAKAGFIVVEEGCSDTLADCADVAMPETEERRVEKRERAPRATKVDMETYEPDTAAIEYAVKLKLDPDRVKADMRAWAANAPPGKRMKKDPLQFWQTWCRGDADDPRKRRRATEAGGVTPLGVGG